MTRVINKLPIISIPPPLSPPHLQAQLPVNNSKKNTYGYKPHSSKKKKKKKKDQIRIVF